MQFMQIHPSDDHLLILSSQEQHMFGISGGVLAWLFFGGFFCVVCLLCFLIFCLFGVLFSFFLFKVEFFGG